MDFSCHPRTFRTVVGYGDKRNIRNIYIRKRRPVSAPFDCVSPHRATTCRQNAAAAAEQGWV